MATVAFLLFIVPIVVLASDVYTPGFHIEQVFLPPGCSYRARDGDLVKKHYTGLLKDGSVFDSSHKRGTTYDFHVGLGEVIRGMDLGIAGVCKGEKRKITIPPELGYGNRAVGSIPASSVLVFDVEIIDIEPSGFKADLLAKPDSCTRKSAEGDHIREHYNGTFVNGTTFDTSYSRGQTYDFVLGENQVIRGVDMGLMNMCVGERRRLTIPALLAYGDKGYDELIPPGSTLIFDVELVEIVKGTLKSHRIDGPACTSDETISNGDKITIIYHGFSENGDHFSSSGSVSVTVGERELLKGLSEGVIGMCVGERRRIKIPPELASGTLNGSEVPQGIRLTLDLELIDMDKKDVFKTIDVNNDKYLSMKEVEDWLKESSEFSERIKDNEKFEKLKAYHHTDRDSNSDGWVSRNEFYRKVKLQRDEL